MVITPVINANPIPEEADLDPKDAGVFEYYRRLNRLKRFVEKYYDEDITLERAAQVAALESSYFSSYFKKRVGRTFSNWLQEYRVARAIEILESEECSITDLAHRVGFADLRTFERAFKRATNVTPFEFKKALRRRPSRHNPDSLLT